MNTRRKRTAKPAAVGSLIDQDRELLQGLIKKALGEILEAEMTEVLGAERGARSVEWLGYRARLSLTRKGNVRYQLKTPCHDDTTHVIVEPLDSYYR